jgi:DNA-binding transcriptional MerR regulator
MMPDEKSYTIGELAQAAEVTIRTVRYYVAIELLPPPESGGRAATYSDKHVARLNLIKILKDEFLPLHEIRALLRGLDDQAVAELLQEKQTHPAPPPPAPNSAKAYLQTLLHPPASPAQSTGLMRHKLKAHQLREEALDQKIAPAHAPVGGAPPTPAPAGQAGVSRPQPDNAGSSPTAASEASMPVGAALPLPLQSTRAEHWQRYQLTPDVELHVKAGLENTSLWYKVEQLLKIAQQLLSSSVIC